eukprot:7874702-Karenia_brevis.AAC.1
MPMPMPMPHVMRSHWKARKHGPKPGRGGNCCHNLPAWQPENWAGATTYLRNASCHVIVFKSSPSFS